MAMFVSIALFAFEVFLFKNDQVFVGTLLEIFVRNWIFVGKIYYI